ncbi:hypothetical protein JHK85_009267 [Glycine max]|nr:hypothetical protein JHK85_009267 [Glycine max]
MATEVRKKTSRGATTVIWLASWSLIMAYNVCLAERVLKDQKPESFVVKERQGVMNSIIDFFWNDGEPTNDRVWPEMKFGWRIVVGSIVGFFGAALGSVGGVGGGGIFIPMLTLVIGFDAKSSTALSKSTSTKALFKGIDTWKKETIMKKEAAKMLESDSSPGYVSEEDYKSLPAGSADPRDEEVPLLKNIYWKELLVLAYVWVAFLIVQIIKVPIAISVTLYEAICLCNGTRVIASKGKENTDWMKLHKICLYCSCGIIAGIVSGLLGLGGGFILGPLFLELGIPPQVASATSTFAMVFSSSMSVVQYYLLERFPVPYASYFILVATIAALTGQHVVRKIIAIFGRASIIIFVLAFTIFLSAISLGGVGIENMVEKMENNEYMGFANICH